MAYPFFELSKGSRGIQRMQYDDGAVTIEMVGGPNGIATVYDKDLIIYIASLMAEKMRKGEIPGREFTFSAHDFMRIAGRETSRRGYTRLKGILERLQGTQIRTSIETGGEGQESFFSWLDSANIKYRRNAAGDRVMTSINVTLCAWLWRAILKDGTALTVHPSYFDLSPLGRRLYEVARAQAMGPEGWKIGIEGLKQRVGSGDDLRVFGRNLVEIAAKKKLPEYEIAVLDASEHDLLAGAAPRAKRPGRIGYKNKVVLFRPRTRAIDATTDLAIQ